YGPLLAHCHELEPVDLGLTLDPGELVRLANERHAFARPEHSLGLGPEPFRGIRAESEGQHVASAERAIRVGDRPRLAPDRPPFWQAIPVRNDRGLNVQVELASPGVFVEPVENPELLPGAPWAGRKIREGREDRAMESLAVR